MGTTATKLPKDQLSEYQVNTLFSLNNDSVRKLSKLAVSMGSYAARSVHYRACVLSVSGYV